MQVNHHVLGLIMVCAALALTMAVASSDAAVNFDNAFAIWLFDEEEDIVVDQSAQGNDATIVGGDWVEGKFGKALQMQDGVTVMSDTVNGVESEFISQTFWIKFDEFATENQFGFINGTGTPSVRFFYFSSWINGGPPHNGVHMGVLDAGGNWGRGLSIPKQFDEEVWYHVAGVADTAAGSLKVYINGSMVNDTAMAPGEVPGTPNQIWAGSGPEGKSVHGIIDEVAFFNVVLTEDEITQIMDDGLGDVFPVEPDGKVSITWANLKR